jgi:UDP-3-O-[3-hydroxymyristoyl] glucosamine N-acyltransferase
MPTIKQLAELLNVPFPNGSDRELRSVNSLTDAGPDDLSVLTGDKYTKQYHATRAAAVIASKKVKFTPRPDVATLIVDDAELALVRVLELMSPPVPHPPIGVHATAVVAPSAILGANVAIGPHVSVGARTTLGRNVRLHPGVVVQDDCVIGDDTILYPNVVVRERVTIGARVIINAGSVIGTDGFGYRWDGRQHVKVPQIGVVVIEDDVEIGSCVCVDRAKFSETRVGRGTKIDNLVQVAHNVKLGMHVIICGQAGVAGTATIGNGVVLGGATVVRDHITVGDGVVAAGHSAIFDDMPAKLVISGMPALPHRQTLREQAVIRRLPELMVELRKLQEEVKRLKEKSEAGAQ